MNAFLHKKQAKLFMAIGHNFGRFAQITNFEIENWMAS